MAAETKTLLGCFQLAPGVDEELQTKTVKLTAATAPAVAAAVHATR